MNYLKYLILLIGSIPIYIIGFIKGCIHKQNPFKYANRFVDDHFGF